MSFSSTTARVQYTGDGTTVDFTVPFPFQADADLGVIVTTAGVDVTKVVNVDYVATGEGLAGGGNVRFTTAPESATTVTIFRDLDLNQTRSFTYNGSFPTPTVTAAADKAMQAAQQLNEKLQRSLRFPVSNGEVSEITLNDRKNKTLTFDANGNIALASTVDLSGSIGPDSIGSDQIIDESVGGAQLSREFRSRAEATVALAKAVDYSASLTNERVEILGYYSSGDGGGGLFRVDKSDTTSTDDGGSVLVAADGTRLKRIPDSIVNVLSFGAKPSISTGDAATNSTAIQAAVTYALSFRVSGYGGKEIYFPAGNYYISTGIVLIRPVGVKITGAGKWATQISWVGASGASVFKLYNARDTRLSDLYISGNATGANKPEALLEVQGDTTDVGLIWAPSNCSFENCRFGSAVLDCANYDVKYTWAGLGNNNDQGVFIGCELSNATEANIYWSVANAKNFRFYACTMTNSKRGVHNAHGSFSWFGGVMSGHSIGNFVFTTMGDTCLIEGIDSENSDRLVYFDGGAGANGSSLVINGGRYSSDEINADGFAIYYRSSGGLHVTGVTLGEYASANTAGIEVNSGGNPGAATVQDCVFGATGSSLVSPVSVLSGGYTMTLKNNSYLDGSNNWIAGDRDAVAADVGDASVTFYPRLSNRTQRYATTLTANRTVTLSTLGAVNGDRFRVIRTGLGAFTLDVGGLKTIASGTAAFVDVIYNGSAWALSGYGTL